MRPLLVLLGAIILFDVQGRLLPQSRGEAVTTELEKAVPVVRSYLPDELYDYYTQKLASSMTPLDAELASGQSSVTIEADLSGLSWQTDLYRYRLVAVFEGAESFAVFRQTTLDIETAKSVKVEVGQQLGGYEVTLIRGRSVALESDTGAFMELRLFDAKQKGEGLF